MFHLIVLLSLTELVQPLYQPCKQQQQSCESLEACEKSQCVCSDPERIFNCTTPTKVLEMKLNQQQSTYETLINSGGEPQYFSFHYRSLNKMTYFVQFCAPSPLTVKGVYKDEGYLTPNSSSTLYQISNTSLFQQYCTKIWVFSLLLRKKPDGQPGSLVVNIQSQAQQLAQARIRYLVYKHPNHTTVTAYLYISIIASIAFTLCLIKLFLMFLSRLRRKTHQQTSHIRYIEQQSSMFSQKLRPPQLIDQVLPPSRYVQQTAEKQETLTYCVVCLDQFNPHQSIIRKTPCGHIFHDVCLKQWTQVQWKCPYCKEILDLQEEKVENWQTVSDIELTEFHQLTNEVPLIKDKEGQNPVS